MVRYEPALDDAISLAVGLGLAEWREGRRLLLTDRGKHAVMEISDAEAFADERGFLAEIGPRLSQAAVDRLLAGTQR